MLPGVSSCPHRRLLGLLPPPPWLLDIVRQAARQRFGQDGPGERYAAWTRRLVRFHHRRHPRDFSPGDIFRFPEQVAQTEPDARNQSEEAPTALTLLDHHVLGLAVGDLPCPEPPRWLGCLRRACRVRPFAPRTEDGYGMWAERFLRCHGWRHPTTLGTPAIEHFLTDLAANGHVAAGTPNQALHALLFLDQPFGPRSVVGRGRSVGRVGATIPGIGLTVR